jgi:hypothetical protein
MVLEVSQMSALETTRTQASSKRKDAHHTHTRLRQIQSYILLFALYVACHRTFDSHSMAPIR